MAVQSKSLHLLVGTSKSGKSHLLRYMLKAALTTSQFKFGLVFTATKFNGGYDWLPDKYVFVSFDIDILLAYLRFLVRIKKSGKEIPPSFIVFDDVLSELPLGTRVWSQFMATFRHYGITLFISTQYVNMADALMRSQTDFAYLFQMHNDAQFKSTYATFGTMLPNIKAWKAFTTKYTGNYKCIVWEKETPAEMAKRYKEFKAPPESKKEKKFEF